MAKIFRIVGWFAALAFSHAASAGIRTVYLNDTRMEVINLSIGKSTIIRFTEKPRKIVIGNQNYFGIEFLDNDVTIQPRGAITTNFFVYCERNTYGFVLRVSANAGSDDLIKVIWRQEAVPPQLVNTPTRLIRHTIDGRIKLAGLEINIASIAQDVTRGLYIIDFTVLNRTAKEVPLGALGTRLTQEKGPVEKQLLVRESESIKPSERSRIRVFARLDSKKNVTVWLEYRGAKTQYQIPRKLL